MALWVCADCTAKYSVGAKGCPECRSTKYREDGAPVVVPSVDEPPERVDVVDATPPHDSVKPVGKPATKAVK